MPVLSVDLAYRRWSDLGIVLLDRTQPSDAGDALLTGPQGKPQSVESVSCEIIAWNELGHETEKENLEKAGNQFGKEADNGAGFPGNMGADSVDPEVLAEQLNSLCGARGVKVLMLDGPQAWKSRHNGLEHSRVSERQLNTPSKTGLPGIVKPATYRRFAEFCLDLYDALCRHGWRRLATCEQPGQGPERLLVESYPYAAWKSLGIKPLPSKRRAQISDLAQTFAALQAVVPLTVNRPPNHDQLQAIVGGLPGLALEEQNAAGARIVGHPPRREEGHWREGFIVLPVPPNKPLGGSLRWLN